METKNVVKISGIILLILVLFSYVIINEKNKYINNKQVEAYNSGYIQAQKDVSSELLSTLSQCKSIKMNTDNNQTLTIIAQECLK